MSDSRNEVKAAWSPAHHYKTQIGLLQIGLFYVWLMLWQDKKKQVVFLS